MNYIQVDTDEVDFFTSLKDVSQWLEIELEDFDWHISDIEGAWPELDDPSWILGKELSNKLDEYDHQFVWSVVSAFPKGYKPFTTESPFADGNQSFWKGSPKKQLEESLFEIVCWDSSATLFIGLSESMSENLLRNAPGIKNLDKYNASRCANK